MLSDISDLIALVKQARVLLRHANHWFNQFTGQFGLFLIYYLMNIRFKTSSLFFSNLKLLSWWGGPFYYQSLDLLFLYNSRAPCIWWGARSWWCARHPSNFMRFENCHTRLVIFLVFLNNSFAFFCDNSNQLLKTRFLPLLSFVGGSTSWASPWVRSISNERYRFQWNLLSRFLGRFFIVTARWRSSCGQEVSHWILPAFLYLLYREMVRWALNKEGC